MVLNSRDPECPLEILGVPGVTRILASMTVILDPRGNDEFLQTRAHLSAVCSVPRQPICLAYWGQGGGPGVCRPVPFPLLLLSNHCLIPSHDR